MRSMPKLTMETLGFYSRVILTTSICVLFFNDCYGAEETAEVRLIKNLLQNYDADARPVKNQSVPVLVELRLQYEELQEVNAPKQSISSAMSFTVKWTDALMQWNKSDYEGISSIRLDPSRVWKPDLTLYNSVDREGGDLYSFKTKINVASDGTMNWLAPTILKTTCTIKVSEFPFDIQTCKMKFGSWTFNSQALQLAFYNNKAATDLSYYRNNTEWELLSFTAKQNIVTYKCCPFPFYDLTYTIKLRRKPLYYIMTVVIPCVLLSLLATISFVFPAESGERVALVVSVLLGLFVFMLIVNDRTPVTSDVVPMISQYFTVIGFSTFMALIATAFILWMHHASTSRPVPYYLAQLTRFLACVLCVGRSRATKTSNGRISLREALLFDGKGLTYLSVSELLPTEKNTTNMQKILHEIQKFAQRLEEDDIQEEMKEDWRYSARVFDRLFFIVFFAACILLNVYVLSFI